MAGLVAGLVSFRAAEGSLLMPDVHAIPRPMPLVAAFDENGPARQCCEDSAGSDSLVVDMALRLIRSPAVTHLVEAR